MKPGLLDVNVLIALIDPAHEFHDAAHDWFGRNRKHGWATCPITENGCVRILSKPAYPSLGLTAAAAHDILAAFRRSADHRFWPDSISIADTRFDLTGLGPKAVTDIYLLGLASANDGKLVTFDRRIRLESVAGCRPENLEILP